jgi:F-type H+-transporting ATPase subunit delta
VRLPDKSAWRYARALLDLAEAEGAVDAVRADLIRIQSWVRESPALAGFLSNYLLERAGRQQALAGLFTSRLHELTFRIIRLLESKKRLALLPDVATCFIERDDRRRGTVRGRLVSPFPLPAETAAAIAGRVQARVEGTLELRAELNPGLLGGFQVWAADRVYDLSVAARLRAARVALSGG